MVVTRLHEVDSWTASFGEALTSATVSGPTMDLALPVPAVSDLTTEADGTQGVPGAKYLLTVHDDGDGDGVVDDDEPVLGHGTAELLWAEAPTGAFGGGWNHVGFGTSCYAPGFGVPALPVHVFSTGDDAIAWTSSAALERVDARLVLFDEEAVRGDTPVGAEFTIAASGTPISLELPLFRPASAAAILVYGDLDASGSWSAGDETIGGVCDRSGMQAFALFSGLPLGLVETWAALDWYCSSGYLLPPGWIVVTAQDPPEMQGAADYSPAEEYLTIDPACTPDWM